MSLSIQSECGKIQIRITPNAYTPYAVIGSSTIGNGIWGSIIFTTGSGLTLLLILLFVFCASSKY